MLLSVVFGCGLSYRRWLSRNIFEISKCNENMLDIRIQKYFKRRKIVLISETKLMSESWLESVVG